MTKAEKITITPETKVAALLDSYPELEVTLISLTPAFSKLKNPLLRKTIARITTLRQAAKVGGVPISKMINDLRRTAGMETIETADESLNKDDMAPSWVDTGNVAKTIDARPMLERGDHPVGIVLKELGCMQDGQLLELITPFIPVPLIEKAKASGYSAWAHQEADDLFKTYFAKSK